VFVLRGVAANLVHQRGVGAYDVLVYEELQWHDVPRVVVLEPFAAKGQSTEILVDHAEQLLGGGVSDWTLVKVKALHVVAAVDVLPDVTLSGRAERFDSVLFALLHLVLIGALDDRNTLSCVDLVPFDAVAT